MNNTPSINTSPGAGIIVVKQFPTGFKVLGLFDQNKGKFDLPKGMIDKGESEIDTALRETFEECGITNLEFTWGKQKIINVSHLTFFIAQTNDKPYVTENPKTGILEHLFTDWMEWEELEVLVFEYLVPAIKQARTIIEGS